MNIVPHTIRTPHPFLQTCSFANIWTHYKILASLEKLLFESLHYPISIWRMFNGSDHFTRYINNIRWDFFSRRIEDDELSNMNGIGKLWHSNLHKFHSRLFILWAAILKPRGVLDVDKVYFCAKDNAKKHQTVRYELVHQKPETPILRRGESFNLRIRFSDDRTFDFEKDLLRLNFKFGEIQSNLWTTLRKYLAITCNLFSFW